MKEYVKILDKEETLLKAAVFFLLLLLLLHLAGRKWIKQQPQNE